MTLFNSDITVLNPRGVYTLAQLFLVASVIGRLHYTWAPTFVERTTVGAVATPDPIAGLQVRLFSIDETSGVETELIAEGSPFTTDASGQIGPAGPGAVLLGHGIDLERGIAEPAAVNTDYSHRVIVEGAGFYRIDQIFQIDASKLDFDFPMIYQDTDFEGEMA